MKLILSSEIKRSLEIIRETADKDINLLSSWDTCIQMSEMNYEGQLFDPATMRKICEGKWFSFCFNYTLT